MKKFNLILVAIMMIAFSGEVIAENYYVNSNTGDDGNNGSNSTPWRK